jgi:hypothetical protein
MVDCGPSVTVATQITHICVLYLMLFLYCRLFSPWDMKAVKVCVRGL